MKLTDSTSCTSDTCNTSVCVCVNTNLNELLVRHVATVKCLLVVHKARKFSLLDFLATQHQHSAGKTHSKDEIKASGIDSTLIWHAARHPLTVFVPRKTAPACHLSLCLPRSGAATNLEGNSREIKSYFLHHSAGEIQYPAKQIFNNSICQMLTCWKMYRLQIPLREPLIGLVNNCLSSRGRGQEAAAEAFRAEMVNKQLKPNKCRQTSPNLCVSFKHRRTVLGEEPHFLGLRGVCRC